MIDTPIWFMVVFGVWFIIVLIILRFTPNDKIRAMGDFFKKVLALIPFSDIIDKLRAK